MRVLVFGARSQLGHDLLHAWPDAETRALSHRECDITDPAAVRAAVEAMRPHLVVNLAAAHRVDELEREPTAAFHVNAYGAWLVARWAAAVGAAVMWISTDYVFSGTARRPYQEEDSPGPVNAYGASKAAGERLVALANPRHYIVRSSGLYGVAGASGKGGNFVEAMLRLAREGRPLRVVNDQVLGPTATADLAATLVRLARSEAFGLYHITNAGAISWHDFAALIFRLTGTSAALTPVSSAEYAAPAPRPTYSVLANERLRTIGLPPLRPIEEALAAYLRAQGYLSSGQRPLVRAEPGT
ncbi:MAG: dTDP-4-dehydrorhamnose reductase [Chloroflexota bacterium]